MVPLTPVVAFLLASVPLYANAQLSELIGTWSSGSKKVQTGSGFANPHNTSFIYPPTAGISYSFTDTWYEIARYRFTSNGSQPNCITAVMNWVHGTYEQASNGSIVLTPNSDGYQQIQDPCAPQSNFIQNYNDTELIPSFYTYNDVDNGLTLQLSDFDGSLLAPMTRVFSAPNMLPTQKLRNVTAPTQVETRRRKRSNAAPRNVLGEWILASAAATVALAVGSSVL